MASREQWVWMPHPAHLIVARNCGFHLATEVGGYLVSTVGEYLPDSFVREILAQTRGITLEGRGDERLADWMDKVGYEEIGYDRTYETMVFKSRPTTIKESKWQCCPYEIIVQEEMEMRGYKTASAAYQGHLDLCEEWSRK